MSITLQSFSIVVVAAHHNPSLLNPDFLRIRDIIPVEFEVSDVLTTAPLSYVKFSNGISLIVETEKLQVIQSLSGSQPENPIIVSISERFIHTLPHVNYRAVGLNWSGRIEVEIEPKEWVKNKFIQRNDKLDDHLQSISLQLGLQLNGTRCNIQLVGSNADKLNEATKVVSCSANFHHDVGVEYPSEQRVINAINCWRERYDEFKEIVHHWLALGELA